jgi:7-carboxy-7-deazaguanine synthase
MAWENIGILGPRDEVKFVLTDRKDYEWAREVRAARLRDFGGAVLFSAARGFLSDTLLAEWILEDGLEVRLQVQLHRVLWPGRDRGV